MDAKIDVEELLREIETRPALWDMKQSDYSDRLKRKKCWEEITDIFADENMPLEEKRKLGELINKKWKNIRDRYARELLDRKGKSGQGARKKAPYVYAQQLQFLNESLIPRETTSSLPNEESSNQEEEHSQPGASSATTPSTSATSSASARRIGKKRLHPIEEQILSTLERCEKKTNVDQDQNQLFLMSLLPSLKSLPRQLNTKCKIELMQCISKYENIAMTEQQTYCPAPNQADHSQQTLPPRAPREIPSYTQYRNSPQYYPMHSRQITELQSQEERRQTPVPTTSPAGSISSYISNFSPEEDSQFSIY